MPPPPVVVVIEDQAELGQVFRDVLGKEGYEVAQVRSTSDALQIMRDRTVAMVVCDLPSLAGLRDDPLAVLVKEFPEVRMIVVKDPSSDDMPFFGPWRRDGSRITLRRPFRLDDVIGAARELSEEPTF